MVDSSHWESTVAYLKTQIMELQIQNRELLESLAKSHTEISNLRVEIALLKSKIESSTF